MSASHSHADVTAPAARTHTRSGDFVALTKPRLNFLVLLTTAAAYSLGAGPQSRLVDLAHTLVGTFLVAAGAERVLLGPEPLPLLLDRVRVECADGVAIRLASDDGESAGNDVRTDAGQDARLGVGSDVRHHVASQYRDVEGLWLTSGRKIEASTPTKPPCTTAPITPMNVSTRPIWRGPNWNVRFDHSANTVSN